MWHLPRTPAQHAERNTALASAIRGSIPDSEMGPILSYLEQMRKVIKPEELSSNELLAALLLVMLDNA